MTRNRHGSDRRPRSTLRRRSGAHRRTHEDGSPFARILGTVLTLLLLAPATALLVTRTRALIDLERTGPGEACTGADTLAPLLHAGLPVAALVLAIPVALLSLGHRSRGWIWLLVALLGVVALEMALRHWLPACL